MSKPLSRVGATIAFLRHLQAARAAGAPVYLTTDPAWLLDMAINRRAGWVEDPHAFGSVNAKVLPRFAAGTAQGHIVRLAHEINTPRLRVYETSLGEWKRYLLRRLPGRFVNRLDD